MSNAVPLELRRQTQQLLPTLFSRMRVDGNIYFVKVTVYATKQMDIMKRIRAATVYPLRDHLIITRMCEAVSLAAQHHGELGSVAVMRTQW